MVPFHKLRAKIENLFYLKDKAKTVQHRVLLVAQMFQAFVYFLRRDFHQNLVSPFSTQI